MNTKYYECAECNGIFEKGWTDKEARREFEEYFENSVESMGAILVCDDCYKKIVDSFKKRRENKG